MSTEDAATEALGLNGDIESIAATLPQDPDEDAALADLQAAYEDDPGDEAGSDPDAGTELADDDDPDEPAGEPDATEPDRPTADAIRASLTKLSAAGFDVSKLTAKLADDPAGLIELASALPDAPAGDTPAEPGAGTEPAEPETPAPDVADLSKHFDDDEAKAIGAYTAKMVKDAVAEALGGIKDQLGTVQASHAQTVRDRADKAMDTLAGGDYPELSDAETRKAVLAQAVQLDQTGRYGDMDSLMRAAAVMHLAPTRMAADKKHREKVEQMKQTGQPRTPGAGKTKRAMTHEDKLTLAANMAARGRTQEEIQAAVWPNG